MSVSDLDVCNYAYEGRIHLLRVALEKNPELLNKADSNSRTALHWACSSGQRDVVVYLLDKGAMVRVIKLNPLI